MHYFRNTVDAQGRRPGPDGLRARLSLLHERHRARVAGQREVQRLAARAAAVHARVPQRRPVAHPPRRHAAQIQDEAKKAMEPVFARTKFSKPIYERRRARWSRPAAGCSRTPSAWPSTTSAAIATARSSRARSSPSIRSSGCGKRTSTCATRTGRRHRYRLENFTDFLPIGARRHGAAGAGKRDRAEGAPDTGVGDQKSKMRPEARHPAP